MKMKKYNQFINESKDTFIDDIKSLNTFEDLKEFTRRKTIGFIPLNPIEPYRTMLRDKIYQIRESDDNKERYNSYLINLEGERKDINIPPGAMY